MAPAASQCGESGGWARDGLRADGSEASSAAWGRHMAVAALGGVEPPSPAETSLSTGIRLVPLRSSPHISNMYTKERMQKKTTQSHCNT